MLRGQPSKRSRRRLDQRLPLIPNITRFFTKISLGILFITILLGSQPALNLPSSRHTLVKAEEAQTQQITSNALPFATQLPHTGYISTYFSRYHLGIDLATGLGMPIKPIAAGTVIEEGYDLFGYGLRVIVDHGSGYTSLYAHMGKIYVQKGQQVSMSDQLGTVGLTGHTTGPHTHLEITQNGTKIDPLTILPAVRKYPQAEDFKQVGSAQAPVTPIKPKTTVALKPSPKAPPMPPAPKKLISFKRDVISYLQIIKKKDADLAFTTKLIANAERSQKTIPDASSYRGGRLFNLPTLFPHQPVTTSITQTNALQQTIKNLDLTALLKANIPTTMAPSPADDELIVLSK